MSLLISTCMKRNVDRSMPPSFIVKPSRNKPLRKTQMTNDKLMLSLSVATNQNEHARRLLDDSKDCSCTDVGGYKDACYCVWACVCWMGG